MDSRPGPSCSLMSRRLKQPARPQRRSRLFAMPPERGDLARLNALLDAHPELIDERGGEGVRTPLHQAVFGNSEAAVKLLLERGANPNIRCEGDNAYPLHFAVEKHRLPIIRLLVEHGADTIGEGDYHELGVIGWATAWDYIQPNPPDRCVSAGARCEAQYLVRGRYGRSRGDS